MGAGIALLLTWIAEEIYDSVKAADGLSSLDEPVLELAVSLRTPHNVAIAQFITNLGGVIGLTVITVVIVVVMTVRWRSRPVAAEPVRIGEDHPCRVAPAARSSPTLGGVAVHGRGAAA